MGWDLSIHRYESMAHAEECLASLGQDQALWGAVDKLRGEIEIEEITKFANTVSYGTAERLEAALEASDPAQPRQYMLAVLQTATGGFAAGDRGDWRAGRDDGLGGGVVVGDGVCVADWPDGGVDRPVDYASRG